MNWDDLRIIAAVRDEGTYAGASARLKIDETTVGRRLSRIQRTLGLRLFEAVDGVRKPTRQCEMVLAHVQDGAQLFAHLLFDGDLLQMEAPGLPGERGDAGERAPFYVARGKGRTVRMITVIETPADQPAIRAVRARGDTIEIETRAGVHHHRFGTAEWIVECDGQRAIALRGQREETPPFVPLVTIDPPTPVAAAAFRVGNPPPLDGTLEGFDVSEPLELSQSVFAVAS